MQFDIHSPALLVRESLQFSAECRLLIDDQKQLLEFVDEVSVPAVPLPAAAARRWLVLAGSPAATAPHARLLLGWQRTEAAAKTC